MITENKITEIFCIADDFSKKIEVEMAKNALASPPNVPKRKRKRMRSVEPTNKKTMKKQ